MANHTSKTIAVPRSALQEKEGVIILPLKKWRRIEEELEDLEMYRSTRLAREIEQRRKEKETVSLGTLLKKYRI